MKKSVIILILCLLSLVAYTQNNTQGIHLSLWHPVATPKYDTLSTTTISIGLLQSKVHRLSGLGLNLVGGVVTNNLSGIQLSGVYSRVKGNANGIIASGFVNIVSGKMKGIEFGGLLNMNLSSMKGIQLSSLSNTSIGAMRGIQITGGYNIASSEASGVQFSPIANITAKGSNIVQVGGMFNMSLESMKGIQLSVGNFADTIKGLQLGVLNISSRIKKGAQIGIFNYSNQESGVQIGLVNISPSSRLDLLTYGGNFLYTNIAARFQGKHTYSIIGIGFPYSNGGNFSGGVFYRYGVSFLRTKRLDVKADAGICFIDIFDEDDYKDEPMQQYALQGRLSLEYLIGRRTSLFVNGGWSFTSENGKSTFKGKPLIEGGVSVLLTAFLGHN